MKPAFVFAFFVLLSFLVFLYTLDLILFLFREKKIFEDEFDQKEYLARLELKQKKERHPQKKNYYLYLICLVFSATNQKEKAQRLVPFLKKDPLLGVDPKSV